MRSWPAVVIAPIVAIVIGAVATALVFRRAASHDARGVASVPALPAAAPGGAPPPSPPPSQPRYASPPGGQFLIDAAARLSTERNGPPALFLLSRADLDSPRYAWQMPSLATSMAEELSDVLAEGCRLGCDPQAERARTLVRRFLEADQRHDGSARTRRWQSDDRVDHRSIATRSSAGTASLEVTCDCRSWPINGRSWNDVATCDATLLDRGRSVLQYSPRVEWAEEQGYRMYPLEAYRQDVKFPDGEALVIESGYNYADPPRGSSNVPRPRAGVRGSLVWSNGR